MLIEAYQELGWTWQLTISGLLIGMLVGVTGMGAAR